MEKVGNKIYYNWEEIGNLIEELCTLIYLKYGLTNANQTFDGVYGVPKGGLPIAVAIANMLDLPLLMQPTRKSIVVDDISDTGITLQNVKHKIVVTLFSTKWTKTKPDIYRRIKHSKKDWIVFPWEYITTI